MNARQPAENDRRCPECGCGVGMHFFDGCHTAFGFICRCKVTRDELLTHVFPPETCACEHPYIGTQAAGEPVRCERCRGRVLPPGSGDES